ncbi:hypothetical protein E0493_09715 [Roseomonas sp. M0104]|uniref:Translation initiation factor IF-2 n=1 Tax=Teichococcus coralli TaxID=2545983 RepID=A0A845B7L0_9PROT|nr:hypothetical protein [Pseudoroseomonas coralli]MXP63623.1 hypothetical protein [Pseudoroseomonas coralli]
MKRKSNIRLLPLSAAAFLACAAAALAQNPLGTTPGLSDGETLKGPEAQGGVANNAGRMAAPRTGTAGNAATQPALPDGQPATPSGVTTEAPTLGLREVRPPTGDPSLKQRPSSAN